MGEEAADSVAARRGAVEGILGVRRLARHGSVWNSLANQALVRTA